MKITQVHMTISISVAEIEAYPAYGSHEDESKARMFKPITATVEMRSGESGNVDVTGFRMKKDGGRYSNISTISYWSWGKGLEDQPAFVHEARAVARDFYMQALGAWEDR